jgi:hypothetical protein
MQHSFAQVLSSPPPNWARIGMAEFYTRASMKALGRAQKRSSWLASQTARGGDILHDGANVAGIVPML